MELMNMGEDNIYVLPHPEYVGFGRTDDPSQLQWDRVSYHNDTRERRGYYWTWPMVHNGTAKSSSGDGWGVYYKTKAEANWWW